LPRSTQRDDPADRARRLTSIIAAIAILSANRLVPRAATHCRQLKHIENFRLDRVIRLASPLRELDDSRVSSLQMSEGWRRSRSTYDRARPHAGLPRRRGAPGRSRADVDRDVHRSRGYTGISEELGDGVVAVLAEYLEAVSTAVLNRGGTIDKVHRRRVMAFGARRWRTNGMPSTPARRLSNANACSPCSA